MRYYLDTNTVAFMLFDKCDGDNIDLKTLNILRNYENIFYVSTIALREMIGLYRDGKLKSAKYKSYKEILSFIDNLGLEIKSFTKQHIKTYAELEPVEGHRDPNDQMIIAQSISDKIPIISSDTKFLCYEKQGLELVFNKRR